MIPQPPRSHVHPPPANDYSSYCVCTWTVVGAGRLMKPQTNPHLDFWPWQLRQMMSSVSEEIIFVYPWNSFSHCLCLGIHRQPQLKSCLLYHQETTELSCMFSSLYLQLSEPEGRWPLLHVKSFQLVSLFACDAVKHWSGLIYKLLSQWFSFSPISLCRFCRKDTAGLSCSTSDLSAEVVTMVYLRCQQDKTTCDVLSTCYLHEQWVKSNMKTFYWRDQPCWLDIVEIVSWSCNSIFVLTFLLLCRSQSFFIYLWWEKLNTKVPGWMGGRHH